MKLVTILERADSYPKLLSSGQIRMKCPFREKHEDGSGKESMYLSPEINAYHCFSCRSKGRLTNMLTKVFEIPLFEAIEMVHIDEYKKEKSDTIEDTEYYWDLTPPDEFIKRSYSVDILRKFKVGTYYDEKRHTDVIVIPMYEKGILKGLQKRIYGETKSERQMWFTKGFDREKFIYNFDANYKDEVILVEGPSDVWRLLMFGYQVYGILGTEMSELQAEQLRKIKKIYIAADCDAPGVEAALSWYAKLYKHTDVEFITYPASDPGKCTFRGFKKAYENPINYAEFNLLVA